MILQTILEGLGLGALLVLVCAVASAKGLLAWCTFTAMKFRIGV